MCSVIPQAGQRAQTKGRGVLPIAACVVITALASVAGYAQTPQGQVQTIGAVHMAVLRAPEGLVRVYAPADAAAGDTIAGVIVREPTGNTPQARATNLARLDSTRLEWQGQMTPVSQGQYEWTIPRTLRNGAAALVLHAPNGTVLSQTSVPLDPVPLPVDRSEGPPEFPREGQVGTFASIRNRFDGRLVEKTVVVGAERAQLLAASPRELIFVVPQVPPGPVRLTLAAGGRTVGEPASMRVLAVRADVPSVGPGQRGTARITVSGLAGVQQPVYLTVRNLSPAVFTVDDIGAPIAIQPGQVSSEGTVVVSRPITGIRPGTANLRALVGSRPLSQFDPRSNMTRTMTSWQARTGVRIAPDANDMIQRSVVETGSQLDEFLAVQQANQGDVQGIFSALLSHYCFDLRDAGRALSTVASMRPTGPPLAFIAYGQTPSPGAEITTGTVRRASFSDVLADLAGRLRGQQSVGYLFVSSTPTAAPIALDGAQKGQTTNRRIVTLAGEHQVVIAARQPCRQQVRVAPFQTHVVSCGN